MLGRFDWDRAAEWLWSLDGPNSSFDWERAAERLWSLDVADDDDGQSSSCGQLESARR